MIETDIEKIVPGLAEEREAERQNRALAFAGITHAVCGIEIRPLTPFARLSLQLVRNRIVCGGGAPRRLDVVRFLQLLSPGHRVGRSRLRSLLAEKLVEWRIRKIPTAAAVREIQLYVAAQVQDAPEGGAGRDVGPWVHWVAADASFWLNLHGGFTLDSYMRTPYLVLQQLHRAWRLSHPRVRYEKDGTSTVEEPDFINYSDRMVADWHRRNAAAVAEIIRERKTRLP